MNMKKVIVILLACISSITISAQNGVKDSVVIANSDSCSTASIQSAIDACLLLVASVESRDTAALRNAKEAMERFNQESFVALTSIDGKPSESLEGHLIFNAEFADSLLSGKDAYKMSNAIHRASSHRGQIGSGVLTKTCFIKARGKSTYTFHSHDLQELAVVAEPGGLITTRIHAVNKKKQINEWHNDVADVAKGRNCRKTSFRLPSSPMSQVTLEIINCTNKDISVVVISN